MQTASELNPEQLRSRTNALWDRRRGTLSLGDLWDLVYQHNEANGWLEHAEHIESWTRLVDGLAAHFPGMGLAIRAVADHILNSDCETHTDLRCDLMPNAGPMAGGCRGED